MALTYHELRAELKDATIELWPDDTGLTDSESGRVVEVVRIGEVWHIVAVAD